MNVIIPKPGELRVRAYCSTCGSLLMESSPYTKRQLPTIWDRAVIGALSIPCKACGHKFPNFDITLKVYNNVTHHEYPPTKYIKLPKNRDTPDELFKKVAERWLKEHPNVKEPTAQEVKDALKETGDMIVK